MTKRIFLFLLPIVLCLFCAITQYKTSAAKDAELKARDVVNEHLKSIGKPEILAVINNRGISGSALVNFIQGGTGKMSGQAMLVSEGRRLGIVMQYGTKDYPGEYFAFDGKDVTVGNISAGQRSPLADFLYRYNTLIKEGLVGGALSLGWPLLDVEKNKTELKYNGKNKVGGQELHELEYRGPGKLNNVSVKLYFDPATFRHMRTDYRIRVRGEMSLQADAVVRQSGLPTSESLTGGGGVRAGSIQDAVPDSIYVLTEKFDDFKEVDGLTLPHSYVMEYSIAGQGSSFVANWTITASQWMHNGKIDASFFRAPDFR